MHTILLQNKSLLFVLDYMHDKEAIKNLFSVIKQFDLVFFDKKEFQNHLLSNTKAFHNYTILYSYERYFELIKDIQDKLFHELSSTVTIPLEKVNPFRRITIPDEVSQLKEFIQCPERFISSIGVVLKKQPALVT